MKTVAVGRLGLSSAAALAVLIPLSAFAPGGHAFAATGTWKDITNGGSFHAPGGIAVDSAGDVFVVNLMNTTTHAVEELPSGSSTWQDITNGGGFYWPAGVAVDSAGDVFVTNAGNTTTNAVMELPKGNHTWIDITNGEVFNYPSGIAVDSVGNVYVTNYVGNTIVELPHGGSTWQDVTHGGSFNGPTGIAVDGAGNLFVTNRNSTTTNAVEELRNGSSTWRDIMNGASFNFPFGIVANYAGDVFVTNWNNTTTNAVEELSQWSSAWKDSTNSGSFNGPIGITVDSAGDMFVVNSGNATAKAVVEYMVPLNPPTLSASNTTSTSSRLTWNTVTGASSYNVYEGMTKIASGVTGTSYTVSNLIPGTSYSFTVTAVNANGESSKSGAANVLTVPTAPTGLAHNSLTQTGWSETWGPINGATGYDVYLNHTKVGTVTQAVYDFTGEQPGTTYTVQVSSVNPSGASPWSTSDAVTTAVYGAGSIPPTIITEFFPEPAQVGQTYSAQMREIGGVSPMKWQITSGSLPPGLTLNNQGVISGTPTSAGNYTFTVKVTDSNGQSSSKLLTVEVKGSSTGGSGQSTPIPPVSVTTGTRQVWKSGQPSQLTLQTAGGKAPYTWSVQGGMLPAGLALNPTTGVISGTPLKTGVYQVTVQVQGASGTRSEKTFSFDILDPNQREVLWDGKVTNVPALVRNDGATPTTYMPIWYVMQLLKPMGITSTWDGKAWHMTMSHTPSLSNIQAGSGHTGIYLNSTLVQMVDTAAQDDPSTRKPTTYMPIWYVMQLTKRVGLQSLWDGTTWTVTRAE